MFDANRSPILCQHQHYLQTDRNELPLEPHHLVVSSSASKMISKPMVRLAQTMHLSCIDTNACLQTERREIPNDPRHIGVPLGPSERISKHMVCLTQTGHLSCIKISTMSEKAKTSLHLSLVTQWYHRLRPKQFLSLWYFQHKPCTYLALTLTLSTNRKKRDST